MIKAITYENIIRKLRNILSVQSEVPLNFIINAVSARGPDIINTLSEIKQTPILLTDTFIIFELLEDDNNDNYVVPEDEDDTMSSISSFKFSLFIYGNDCHTCAQKIRTRFKNVDVATALRNEGIFITGITYPDSVNEFINNTVWPRVDIDINLKVRFNFKNLSNSGIFDEEYTNLTVIKI